MRLLLLLDKKPGHFHQTEGVAKALERVAPVAIDRLKVRQRPFVLVGMLRLLMKLRLSPPFWLWALYGIRVEQVKRPDGIVASGRPTIAAAIMLARHFNVPLVYSGLITGYDTRDVTLQLVRKPAKAGKPGYAVVPKPTLVDRADLPPPRPISALSDFASSRIALLIGGDATDCKYTGADWHRLAAFIRDSSETLALQWHVSTSRRSPPALADALAELHRAGHIANFIDYRQAGPGSAAALFGLDTIVVTQDSRSMIAEASAAQRPLVILRPDTAGDDTRSGRLATRLPPGTSAVLTMADLEPMAFANAVLALKVQVAANPQDLIAAAVAPVFDLSAAGETVRQ